MMKEFRMLEFSKKLKKANKTRMKGYEDVKIDTGGDVFIFANGNMRKVPRCNVQLSEKHE